MKFANSEIFKSPRTGTPEQVVLFLVANQAFAIAADAVQEIRSTDSLSGTANEIERPVLMKVRHTLRRARHTYYVVSANSHFGLPASRPTLLMILRGLRVAVLVDRIDRMTEIASIYPLPLAFDGKERNWYRGLAYLDDRVIPVVQPEGFLAPQELEQLEAVTTSLSPKELEGVL